MRLAGLAPFALLVPHAAMAEWPEDVSLSGMTVHGGARVVDQERLAADYAQLIRELGASISTSTILPANTLGAKGFEVAIDSNLSFIDVREGDGNPSPWARAHADEDPGQFLFTPGLTVRKGLPFSLELGFTGKWVGLSRQGVFGGFGRVALVEGWKPYPDINLHMGYTGYIGNDELALGVFDVGGTLGSAWRLGTGRGVRGSEISTYVDVSLLVISATPILDDATVIDVGAVTYGARSNNPDALPPEAAIVLPRFSGGLQLTAGRFLIRVSGGYTLNATGNLAAAVGFTY